MPASNPPDRPSRLRVRAVSLALLALAAGGGFFAAHRSARASGGDAGARTARTGAAPAPAPVEVSVERVVAGTFSGPIRVTGTLRTDEMVTLSTKATGLVRHVAVKEGDRVRRGQLLVEIDAGDLKAQRARAAAAVRAAEAQVLEARASVQVAEALVQQSRTSRGMRDTAVESENRRAGEALESARSRVAQARALAGIAATEAETRVASAKAGLQAARERLQTLRDGSRRQERAAAEAGVLRAQAQVTRARSNLARREQLFADKAIAAEVVENHRRDLDAAQADLDAARQQLSLVLEGPRSEEVRAQEQVVQQAEAALRDAEAYRARRLVSDRDVDAAENAVQQAEAGLDTARAGLAQRSWNADEIRGAEAALAQARAAVARAQAATHQARADVRLQDELISQTRIYSPVNGIVTSRQVQAGAAVVQMRNEMMTLVSSDTLYFEATAPETQLPLLRPGLPARVVLDASPGRIFPGVLREIIPVAQGTNRSVRLRIAFPRPPRAVVGGFARAEIRGASERAMVSVPRAAVVSDDGQLGVFVLAGGRAALRRVTLGDPGGTGDRVAVQEGLRPGEQVIVSGAAGLTEGQPVTVSAGGDR